MILNFHTQLKISFITSAPPLKNKEDKNSQKILLWGRPFDALVRWWWGEGGLRGWGRYYIDKQDLHLKEKRIIGPWKKRKKKHHLARKYRTKNLAQLPGDIFLYI